MARPWDSIVLFALLMEALAVRASHGHVDSPPERRRLLYARVVHAHTRVNRVARHRRSIGLLDRAGLFGGMCMRISLALLTGVAISPLRSAEGAMLLGP